MKCTAERANAAVCLQEFYLWPACVDERTPPPPADIGMYRQHEPYPQQQAVAVHFLVPHPWFR